MIPNRVARRQSNQACMDKLIHGSGNVGLPDALEFSRLVLQIADLRCIVQRL